MRKHFLFSVLMLGLVSLLFAQQPPTKMSYQIVVRNQNNELVTNQNVGVKISILEDTPSGVTVYMETYNVNTNANALATLEIGAGTLVVGTTLADIAWESHDYFIKAEIDPTGGSNYTVLGTQQLLTVPYAFYSGKTAYFDYNDLDNKPQGNNTGDILYWDASDTSWHIIPVGSAGQVLTLNPNGIPQWYSTVFNQSVPPTVVTDTVYDITGRTVKVMCHIVNPGSTGVIASGVCWSTNPNPSIGNQYTTDGTIIDTFVSLPTGLTSGTTYYVRAYATNSVGTSYGLPLMFTTPTSCGEVYDYDNNKYNTIYIGSQCWMKENLRTTHYSNGVAISKGVKPTAFSATTDKYYFEYDDNVSNVQDYGRLYTWAAAMNGAGSSTNNPSGIQGICPTGWHLPSSAEWCELENYIEPGIDVSCSSIGERGSMAKALAYPDLWSSYGNNSFAPGYCKVDITGFNTSDFCAKPAGYYQYYSWGTTYGYYYLNLEGHWWTCTLSNSSIISRSLEYSSVGVYMNSRSVSSDYRYAYSVRCVKN